MQIAYFGGSFDPVHLGHMGLVAAILEQGDADLVRMLPVGVAPHKSAPPTASPVDRLEMLELACNTLDGVEIDARELNMDTPCYSVRTFREVCRQAPHDEFMFVVGTDMLADLPRWHRIEELVTLVSFLVARRPGGDLEIALEKAKAIPGMDIRVLETDPIRISSTEIRGRVARGEGLDGLVPAAVEEFILRRGIYGV